MQDAIVPFFATDIVRRAQGAALDLMGLGPSECPYEIVASGAGWRLRHYSGCNDGPAMLIVSAPIKRPYIWDLAPDMSAVRICKGRGLRVFLVEWMPPEYGGHRRGLSQYAEDIGNAVEFIAGETSAARPFVVGHSLGGTLAAIYAALEPERIEALVLLDAPLCFRAGVSRFGDALAGLAAFGLIGGGPIPGSLLSQISALASPEEFLWARAFDATISLADVHATELHARVERWTLDEVPLSGQLVEQIVQWLYREDRFCRGRLCVRGRIIGPSCLRMPTLAVVNTADRVAPPETVKPFLDEMPPGNAQLLLYSGDVGACLQHLAVLVGRQAHARIWPAIISWLKHVGSDEIDGRKDASAGLGPL